MGFQVSDSVISSLAIERCVSHLVCLLQKRNDELRFGGEAAPT